MYLELCQAGQQVTNASKQTSIGDYMVQTQGSQSGGKDRQLWEVQRPATIQGQIRQTGAPAEKFIY